MAILEFESITKQFGDVIAVHDLSFKTEDGEFLVILGPSGAGKTTTLKITCGLVLPTQGRVILNGENITKVPPYKRDIAMTFENYSLYPHMTIYNNMAYPLRAEKGMFSESEIKEKVVTVARMLHIDPLLQRFPAEASGGQKQRIALGRTMVRDPKIYLLDEPLAHLDAKIRVELREEFHRLEALKRSTTIYVTHDYTEALSLGDRIMVLDKGELLQVDSPEAIFSRPLGLEVARQVGQPEINSIECKMKRNGGRFLLQSVEETGFSVYPSRALTDAVRKYKKNRIILGIRPQDISIIANKRKTSIQATVDVFQPLGSEGVLTIDVGKLKLVALVDPETNVSHKTTVTLYFDSESLYLFDIDTKKNIALQ